MAANDYLLSILAVFKDAASGDLKKFGTAVLGAGKATEKAGKKASSFGDKLTVLSAKFVSLRTAASQAQELFQRGFEFAELGAQSIQTTASFDGLIDSLDAAPGTLDELRSASRNTISDLDMMSSTMTLLAGAQGELATALAGSTPKLMEIAKAANALNPALGTTTQLYQSLAFGVKRASPMRLDDLGLTIKIGEANKVYAESIGKTVEQLTAEEQKMALLNETLRAGNVLIEQAGDNIDSATDDFAGFETALKNAKIALAEFAVPVLAPLLKQLADVLSIMDKEYDAIEKAKQAAREAANDRLGYAHLIRESLIVQMLLEGQTREEAERRISVTQDGQLAILGLAGRSARAWQQAMDWIPGTYDYWQEKIEGTAAATIDLNWEETKLGAAQKKQREELIGLVKSYGDGIDVMAAFGYEVTAHASAVRDAEREAGALGSTTLSMANMFGYAERALNPLVSLEKKAEAQMRELTLQQNLFNKELSKLGRLMDGAVGSALGDYNESRQEILRTAGETRGAIDDEEAAIARLGGRQGYGGLQETLGGLEEQYAGVLAEMDSLGPAGDRSASAEQRMRELEWAALNTNTAIEETKTKIDEVGARNAVWDQHTEKIAGLRSELGEAGDDLNELAERHRDAMNRMIFDMVVTEAAAGDFTDAERTLIRTLAESLDLVDPQTAQAWGDVGDIVANVSKINLGQSISDIQAITDALAGGGDIYQPLPFTEAVYQPLPFTESFGVLPGGIPEGMQATFDDMNTEMGEVLGTADDPREAFIEVADFPLVKSQGDFLRSTVNQWEGDHHAYFYGHYYTIDEPGAGPGNGGGNGDTPPAHSPWSRQLGGSIDETGWYFLHQNEIVIPPMEAQQMQQGGGTTIAETNNEYNLNVTSVQEMTSLMQEFEIMRALAE